jgi:diaminohydroxyphosphoribosylaminopyrimidine deaminase/5-amino-6-(5-phosphoribosylamino)uracil reductase
MQTMSTVGTDIKFMKTAIRLGQQGRGFTEPNPLVGAVVVRNNRLISTGCHRAFGGEHAERTALRNVSAAGATLYVPLEPCSHYGKQPPCDEFIIEKGVKRVVISTQDPCPLVNGRGIKKLRKNGIRVDEGCLEEMYWRINRHYFKYISRKSPYVTLRAGVSIDGKLTDRYRNSRWVTDARLRDYSHSLRGEFSAILVGKATVLADDPQLTIREDAWKGKGLTRVVLDSGNSLPPGLRIFKEQENFPTMIFSTKAGEKKGKKGGGHFFVDADADGSGVNLNQVLAILGWHGIASLLVEGGGEVIGSFLQRELYDEIILFTAHKLLGGRDSVQLFSSGKKIAEALVLAEPEILTFDSGCIVRGFRAPASHGPGGW